MSTPASLLDGQLIPFPNSESYFFAIVSVVMSGAGLILNSLLLLSNRSKSFSPNSVLVLSLCFSDIILCLDGIITLFGSVIRGGYGWGQLACYLNCFFAVTCCCVSLLLIASMGIERYLASCWNKTLSNRVTMAWVVVIWIWMLGFNLYTMISPNTSMVIMLDKKAWFCLPQYKPNDQPNVTRIMVVAFVLFICIVIVFSYLKVYFKVLRLTLESTRKEAEILHRKVFVQCSAIGTLFLVGWSPEFVVIFLEFSSGKTNMGLSIAASVFIFAHTVMNPILIMHLDPNMMKRVKVFLGIDPNHGEAILKALPKANYPALVPVTVSASAPYNDPVGSLGMNGFMGG